MARPGRRPGPSRTKDEILDVARRQFAERGYAQTTIRSIAAGAGVHPALLHHYFGTKQQLYRDALDLPVDPLEVLLRLLDETAPEQFAEALTRHFISTWRDPVAGAWLRAAAQHNIATPQGIALARAHWQSLVIPRIAKGLNIPEAQAATGLASLIGITWADSLFGIAQLNQLSQDELVALVAPILERHFLGPS
jgi:AcrR family transcriptional regulator